MKRAPRSAARPQRIARSRDEGAKLARTRSTLKKEEDEQITPRKRDPEVKEVADWVTEHMNQHPDEVWLIKNHVQKGAHKLSRRRKQPGELTPFLDSVSKIMHIRGEIIDAALHRVDARWADHLKTVRSPRCCAFSQCRGAKSIWWPSRSRPRAAHSTGSGST